MHAKTAFKKLLKIDKMVIKNVYFEDNDGGEIFVVRAKPIKRELNRCPECGTLCGRYDRADKIKRWRSLDFGSTRVYIEAGSPRVNCPKHGVITARVPWARHKSDFTYNFEQAVTWFTLHATAQDVAEYFRIDWHTVSSIAKRVQKSLEELQPNRFDNLVKIGIDETSYKKGHKYMTVVVNHETGALIWAKKGHGKEILESFFEELSDKQRESIKLVSADGARWIKDCIEEYCPNAKRCVDPFHVVMWANDALDKVRIAAVKEAKKDAADGKTIQGGQKKGRRKASNIPY
jgi:transposase